MKNSLAAKFFIVAGLMLVLVVPLMMIQGKISERSNEAWQVKRQIGQQVGGEQLLAGPMIVVKRTLKKKMEKANCERGKSCTYWHRTHSEDRHIPEVLAVNGQLQTELRYRGIYGSPVYRSLMQFEASFPDKWRYLAKPEEVEYEQAYVVMNVSSLRGLVELPQFMIGDQLLPLVETDALPASFGKEVVAAILPRDLKDRFDLKVRVNVNGAESLSVLPLAKETRISLQADWPHPSFEGLVLPVEREISADGFTSQWRTNSLAAASAIHCARNNDVCSDTSQALRVKLVQPVTGLLSSERALKYSFLIVGLAFAAFFLFEVLRRYPLHPMQYLLVGLALAMFYLLLVALSEHVDFALAYLAAALSCCGLIGIYLMAVMRSARVGWGFAFSLLLVQGLIYGILMAEDYALLLGALLLFAALSAIMLVTRKLDWYAFSGASKTTPAQPLAEPV